MNMQKAEKLLQATPDEEKATDAKLSALAVLEINIAAEEGDGEEAAPRRWPGGGR
jgi:ferritin-like metal-binding protein YciE